jgi:hypothetical protein
MKKKKPLFKVSNPSHSDFHWLPDRPLLIMVLLILFITPAIPADKALVSQENKAIQETARKLADLMAEEYILPEIGRKTADLILSNIQAGVYDSLRKEQDLAEQLQRDARSLSRDRHIVVRYAPQQIRARQNPELREKRSKEARFRSTFENHGFAEIRILPGGVGYIKLNSMQASPAAFDTAAAAMGFVASCHAVIIDLRWNPGGDSRMVQLIASYFLGPDPKLLDVFHYRKDNEVKQIWSSPAVPGRFLDKTDLYLLTSGLTFSAAEGLAYDLQALQRATIVGETTMGGGHAVKTFSIQDKFMVYLPHALSKNPVTGENFQGTGVKPDVVTSRSEALTTAHALALKERIRTEPDTYARTLLQWAHDGIPTTGVCLSDIEKKALPGTYGPSRIALENDTLYYHFGPGKLRMVPVREGYFRLDNYDEFRIRVLKDNTGEISGLRICWKDGRTSNLPRTGQ